MLQFLIPLISFTGIIGGILLKNIAQEEVKFGKFGGRYFLWIKRIILFLLILIISFFTTDYLFLSFGIIVGLILGIFITEYLFLGLTLLIGFNLHKNILLITSSLTFLYGLPYGSIMRRIKLKQIIAATIFFFLPFLFLLTSINLNLIIGISTGGLFQYLIRK